MEPTPAAIAEKRKVVPKELHRSNFTIKLPPRVGGWEEDRPVHFASWVHGKNLVYLC